MSNQQNPSPPEAETTKPGSKPAKPDAKRTKSTPQDLKPTPDKKRPATEKKKTTPRKKRRPKSKKKPQTKLEPMFADLEELLESRRGNKGLSNAVSLEIGYEKGLYPYRDKLPTREYEQEKLKLQAELLRVQKWVRDTGQRVVLLFEGRDAAGKGGTIKRFMEHLNPRAAHVVALEKPTDRERSQWFFQRYIKHLPAEGEMTFFDRSWYNRTGVEKVMGFCSSVEYLEFLRQAPLLERMLVNSGIRLFKYWFSVSRTEQLRRFHARKTDPLKQWKLSPVDMESLGKWKAYTKAKEAMFFYTDTADAPWTVIKSDDKKRARLNCIRHFLSHVDYTDEKSRKKFIPDPKIVIKASDVYERENFLKEG